mgnify:CR=1 FL=1
MPGDETNLGTVSPEPVGQESTQSVTTQTVEPPATDEGEKTAQPQITRQQVEEYLKTVDDKELGTLEPVTRAVHKGIETSRQREQKAAQERDARIREDQRIAYEVNKLDDTEKAHAFIQDPSLAKKYRDAVIRLQGDPHAEQRANELTRNLYDLLKEESAFADLSWDEIHKHKDPVQWLRAIIMGGLDKEKKGMEKSVESLVEAKLNEKLAAMRLSGDQPKLTGAPASGASGRFTREQVKDPVFYAQHRDEILEFYKGR